MPLINLEHFVREERPYWTELEQQLDQLERGRTPRLALEELQRFHYLYQRAGAGLARVATFAGEGELRGYLEHLVARSYGLIHETRSGAARRFRPLHWLLVTFPATVRAHAVALLIATLGLLLGGCFGAFVLGSDYESKWQLIPGGFEHLHTDPSQRVADEETSKHNASLTDEATFASQLMINNTRVSILTLGAGVSWGVGSLLLLFYNGILLGAVVFDYLQAGEGRFLLGWLLPHGSVEIPAIMLAGQAGLVLGSAVIGWGRRVSLRTRLRRVAPDLVTLIGGIALLLIWAGLIEAFLSQKHEPAIPYDAKIAFGAAQLLALACYLGFSGRGARRGEELP